MENRDKIDLLFNAMRLLENEVKVNQDYGNEMSSLSHREGVKFRETLSKIATKLMDKKIYGGNIDFSEEETIILIEGKIDRLKEENVIPQLIKSLLFYDAYSIEEITATDIEARIDYLKNNFYSKEEIQRLKAEARFEGFNVGWLEALQSAVANIKTKFPSYNTIKRRDLLRFFTKMIKESNAGKS